MPDLSLQYFKNDVDKELFAKKDRQMKRVGQPNRPNKNASNFDIKKTVFFRLIFGLLHDVAHDLASRVPGDVVDDPDPTPGVNNIREQVNFSGSKIVCTKLC